MKIKVNNWLSKVSIFIFAVLLIIFVVYNIFTNPMFWSASAVSCITIGIAIFVSYCLVQRQNNKQKQKELILELIRNLQLQIEKKETYDFSGQSREEVMMRKRDIANKIRLLESVNGSFLISEDVDYIKEKFEEYDNDIGDYIDKFEVLIEIQKTLKRPIDLIDVKLFEMGLHLYIISTEKKKGSNSDTKHK